MANAIEKIKRLRNHPSIAIWCGDNEGYPNGPLNGWLADDVKTYDGNDRRYQPNSHAGSLTGSGPWGNADPTPFSAAPENNPITNDVPKPGLESSLSSITTKRALRMLTFLAPAAELEATDFRRRDWR